MWCIHTLVDGCTTDLNRPELDLEGQGDGQHRWNAARHVLSRTPEIGKALAPSERDLALRHPDGHLAHGAHRMHHCVVDQQAVGEALEELLRGAPVVPGAHVSTVSVGTTTSAAWRGEREIMRPCGHPDTWTLD